MEVAAITPDEYKERARVIDHLQATIEDLGKNEAFNDVVERMQETLRVLADSLGFALADLARRVSASDELKPIGYYVDDLWEALGRYAYNQDAADDIGVKWLTNLGYTVGKITEAIAPPEAPEPATVASSGVQPDKRAAALVSAVAADSDSLPVGEAMDEFEREQAPS